MRSAIIAAALLLAGCGGSSDGALDDKAAAAACVTLDRTMLDRIADGLKHTDTTVTSGASVELPAADQQFGYTQAVAVVVEAGDESDTVVLFTGGVDSGPIMAGDHVARVAFTWGEAATDDSPIGQWRDASFTGAAARAAQKCLD